MADFRTKPDTELTYYVASQIKGSFNMNRYDTLDEAIEKYKEEFNLANKFCAIGISKNKYSEIDIIHKNNDSSVLVTDYLQLVTMKNDREIRAVVAQAVDKLNIQWELNRDIFNNSIFSSLCIPRVSEKQNLLHNENVDVLSLDPERIDNSITAVEKMYADGKWQPTFEVMTLCRDGKHPFIESLKIKVEDSLTGDKGKINVSPHDYLQMADNYVLSNQKCFSNSTIAKAIDKLAGKLNDFFYDYDPYEYKDQLPAGGELEVIENIAKDLQNGNCRPYVEQLNSIIAEGNILSDVMFQANELLNRLMKIVPEKDKEFVLNKKIEAASRSSMNLSQNKAVKDNHNRDFTK